MDIDNILISNKISFGEKNYKYFIGYMDDDYKIKLLFRMLKKISAYVKRRNSETNWMYFLIENDDLLKKYDNIWNNIKNSIKENLIANPSTVMFKIC